MKIHAIEQTEVQNYKEFMEVPLHYGLARTLLYYFKTFIISRTRSPNLFFYFCKNLELSPLRLLSANHMAKSLITNSNATSIITWNFTE